jgi:hypothetical protein
MLRSQFSAIFPNIWRKNWRFIENQCYDPFHASTSNILTSITSVTDQDSSVNYGQNWFIESVPGLGSRRAHGSEHGRVKRRSAWRVFTKNKTKRVRLASMSYFCPRESTRFEFALCKNVGMYFCFNTTPKILHDLYHWTIRGATNWFRVLLC